MGHLLLIDLFSIFHRSRNAFRTTLTTPQGVPCRGTYVLIRTLLKELSSIDYTHAIIATEGLGGSLNKSLDSSYKGNREKNSEDFYRDLRLTEDFLKILRLPLVSVNSQEADDTIASLVKAYHGEFNTLTIFSCDSDFFQLIDSKVHVKQFTSSKRIHLWEDNEAFIEKNGVSPEWYSEWKSLTGDSADNIPGVKNVGPKTAAKIIMELGSSWREHVKLQTPEIQSRLDLNLQLITLNRDLELPEIQPAVIELLDTSAAKKYAVNTLGFTSLEKLKTWNLKA